MITFDLDRKISDSLYLFTGYLVTVLLESICGQLKVNAVTLRIFVYKDVVSMETCNSLPQSP